MRAIAVAATVLAATGCGPLLYYYAPQTREYEFERIVPVTVRSDPPGATIATTDGTVIGRAPLILEDKVRVRRTHHAHSPALAVLGCIADYVIAASIMDYSFHHPASRLAGAATIIGSGQILGCSELGLAKLLNSITKRFQFADQEIPIFSTPDHTEDRILPRSIDLLARWDGLASLHATVVLPTTRMVTLRFPHSYSFDEALVLWAEAVPPPLPVETLYRVGCAYRNLARRGVPGARERAVDFLNRYLNTRSAVEHAEEARRVLDELARPERHER